MSKLKGPTIILLIVAALAIVAMLAGCAQPDNGRRQALLDECRAWDGWVARATTPRDAARYRDASQDCWNQVADSADRLRDARSRMNASMPDPTPSAEIDPYPFSDYRRPSIATPDAMPIPGTGAQTPPRGPMTWGETPFAVPPIMRDVPVEQFPWLAH